MVHTLRFFDYKLDQGAHYTKMFNSFVSQLCQKHHIIVTHLSLIYHDSIYEGDINQSSKNESYVSTRNIKLVLNSRLPDPKLGENDLKVKLAVKDV